MVDIPLDQVQAVEGPEGFRTHTERLPAFVIGGAILGGIVGYMVRTPSKGGTLVFNAKSGPTTNVSIAIDGGDGHPLEGVAIGAAAGAFFGLLASHGRGPTKRWTFDERGVATPQ